MSSLRGARCIVGSQRPYRLQAPQGPAIMKLIKAIMMKALKDTRECVWIAGCYIIIAQNYTETNKFMNGLSGLLVCVSVSFHFADCLSLVNECSLCFPSVSVSFASRFISMFFGLTVQIKFRLCLHKDLSCTCF